MVSLKLSQNNPVFSINILFKSLFKNTNNIKTKLHCLSYAVAAMYALYLCMVPYMLNITVLEYCILIVSYRHCTLGCCF